MADDPKPPFELSIRRTKTLPILSIQQREALPHPNDYRHFIPTHRACGSFLGESDRVSLEGRARSDPGTERMGFIMKRMLGAGLLALPLIMLTADKAKAGYPIYWRGYDNAGYEAGAIPFNLFRGIHQHGPLFNYGPIYPAPAAASAGAGWYWPNSSQGHCKGWFSRLFGGGNNCESYEISNSDGFLDRVFHTGIHAPDYGSWNVVPDVYSGVPIAPSMAPLSAAPTIHHTTGYRSAPGYAQVGGE